MAQAKSKQEFLDMWDYHIHNILKLNHSLDNDDERNEVRKIVKKLMGYVNKAANVTYPKK